VPESEIVLRERAAEVPRAEPARLRRGLFAGLKLDANPAAVVTSRAASPTPMVEDQAADQLAQSVGVYARAWADAERMRQAGLPVLPHQTEALARADRALEGQRPSFGQDLDAALTRTPRLAHSAGTDAGLAALIEAGRVESERREALEKQAREVVRVWGRLERAYEQAGEEYDHLAQREIGARMEQFAKELKWDPQLDSVLRQRGQQLGVAEGSRLERVVQSMGIDRELRRTLGLRHSHSLGLGR
jgi:hypothetical protein